MTKEEFLKKEIRDLKEIYEKHGSIDPTFTLLFDDGSTESICLAFEKEYYKLFMEKICENPGVTASIFTSEGWSSSSADDSKAPSECDDKKDIIMLLYSTRDNIHECHLYKPLKDGGL
mgnify:CR=1 FL=1